MSDVFSERIPVDTLERTTNGTISRRSSPRGRLVADGKRDVRRVENRHILEPHEHVVRHAFLPRRVEVDGRGLQHPVLVARGTARIAHRRQLHLAVREDIDVLRETATVAVHELKVRLIEIRRAVDVVAAGAAAHAQLRIREIHTPLDGDAAGLFFIGDRIGGHAARILAHADAPVQHGVAVIVEHGVVAVDVDAVIVRGDVLRERRLELRRGGTHVDGPDQGGNREAKDNECGSDGKSHGQNASP